MFAENAICWNNIESNEEVKRKVANGEYRISNKRGRSELWDFFGPLINDKGEDILPHLVACKICNNIYKYSKNGTSNLSKHKCFIMGKKENNPKYVEVSQEQKKICTEILTEWVTASCRPYSMVKDEGLQKYTEFILPLGAKCGGYINIGSLIPNPTTLYRNVENIYTIHFNNLKKEIVEIKDVGYGLTSDIWTDSYVKISYVSLTIHYILNGELKSKLLVLKSLKGLSSSSFNIRTKIECLLNEYDCSLKDKTIIVTDRGANMKAALIQYQNIFCVNHLINNTIEKSINNSPKIKEIVTSCSKLVKYFKKSGENCGLMTTLKSVCPTRWNTQYYTLLSIYKNYSEVQNVLVEKRIAEQYIIIKEYYLEQIINALRPFEEASKKLEGDLNATIHLVHPYIQHLKTKCIAVGGELDFIIEFKNTLLETLKLVVENNITIYHKMAISLFPPANQLSQFSTDEREEIINKCKILMKPYMDDTPKTNQPVQTQSSSGIFHLFQSYARQIEISEENTIENEILKYQSTSVPLDDTFNVLNWWYFRQNEFPLLYKLCCRILAVPASSAPSERIFSKARNLITDKRSQIGVNQKSFNHIMFINVNVKNSPKRTE